MISQALKLPALTPQERVTVFLLAFVIVAHAAFTAFALTPNFDDGIRTMKAHKEDSHGRG